MTTYYINDRTIAIVIIAITIDDLENVLNKNHIF